MRVMAGNALFAVDRANFPLPVTAGAAMNARLPIPISRAVTTPAQGGAFVHLQLAAIAGLQDHKVGFVMAVETIIIAVMAAMLHDHIFVLFWDDQVVVGVIAQGWRL